MKPVTEKKKSPRLLLIALSVPLALWPAHLQGGWLTRISSAWAKGRGCLTSIARPTSVKGKPEKRGMSSLRLVLPCTQGLILFPDPSCSEHPRGLSCQLSPRDTLSASRPSGLYQVGKGFCSTSFNGRGTRALVWVSHTPHSQAVNSLPAPPLPHSRP